jgi:osmotically-inducible protein OsmY
MAEYWDRERDRDRGRRYRGEGYYGGYYGYPGREREYERRGDDRGFFDRAGDEVRSWFGDDEAQRRRMRDEREGGDDRGWWSGRERDDERRWGGSRVEDPDREWARQWGYVEPRGARGSSGGGARGWGYSGGYGAGPGFTGGRSEFIGSGGYEPGGAVWSGPPRYGLVRGGGTSGPHVGRGPRGYQRSDERIHEEVCERMSECGDLDASDIEVRVSGAEVTLTGVVRERPDKRLAEDLAEQVSGVREVHNQLRVDQGQPRGQEIQPPPQQRPGEQRYRIA